MPAIAKRSRSRGSHCIHLWLAPDEEGIAVVGSRGGSRGGGVRVSKASHHTQLLTGVHDFALIDDQTRASFGRGVAVPPGTELGFDGATASGLPGTALRLPASLVRFSISALIATTRVLPDIDSAATSGLSTNG